MKSAASHITTRLQTTLMALGVSNATVAVSRSNISTHGDFSTSCAMELSKQVRDQYPSARDLAQAIADHIEPDEIIATISVAGPGFINFAVTEEYLTSYFKNPESFPVQSSQPGKRIIIEFTDPNPFKELHIGHLYSNIVGECVARLFESQGATVQRVCYQGDVGMHVAKSIWGMKKKLSALGDVVEQAKKLENQSLSERMKFLGQSYARGAQAYEEQAEVKEEIKKINFACFQTTQEQFLIKKGVTPQISFDALAGLEKQEHELISALYWMGRAWSLEYFNSQYHRIGMSFNDFFFESVVGDAGLKLVMDHMTDGIFEKSNGAVIFPGSKHGLHDRVFINSLGLPTYEAKELGLAPEKMKRFPHDLSIIITGNEINAYFTVLQKAMELIYPNIAQITKHISHGMVRLPEGKMSSRTGKIITAESMIDNAVTFAQDLVKTTEKKHDDIPQETLEQIALGAIKYAFLKPAIGQNISFDFKESISFLGNSGPYLQYTAVRAKSVLDKSHTLDSTSWIPLSSEERLLAATLIHFDAVVSKAANEYAPHHLCTYLFELAQTFNTFYNSTKIIGSGEHEGKRRALTHATAVTLQKGLHILGISVPSSM